MTVSGLTVSHDALTIIVGVLALIMVVREVIKLGLIIGLVAKYGTVNYYFSYWVHMAATGALVVWFVLLITGKV